MAAYNKFPATKIENAAMAAGWDEVLEKINNSGRHGIIAIDCYTGVSYEGLKEKFKTIPHSLLVDTKDLFHSEDHILQITDVFLSDDVLFGYKSNLVIADYFDTDKLNQAKENIISEAEDNTVIIYGYGSSLVAQPDLLIYADMPRWEIVLRMRKKEVLAIGCDNRNDDYSFQYKRGYFNDWHVLDKHKKTIYERVDFWLDTTNHSEPKLIDKETFFKGIEKTIKQPFRVMPFFDSAPWGGQWMKEVCGLDKSVVNYGWCFDCVPDENSLLFEINGKLFEMPSVNLVYLKNKELLGESVYARFGDSFPIRFDLLDTFDGGNLSLQVHPTTQYTFDNFGLPYTQDESYYVVDTEDDGIVYLGLKEGVDSEEMLDELNFANDHSGHIFNEKKYVNAYKAKKHDHFLIPAGTIHCSGRNTLVLEISSTPNLFTFKLWDWNRLGLDGKPRPINISRGEKVLQWDRDTDFTNKNLINQFEVIEEGDGWLEEKTGLYKTQFIETRRHTFTEKVEIKTNGSVNVLCLVDGDEIVVESPTGSFEPYIVHYAETFIVPASISDFTMRPHGKSEGKECITIKANVRI